jgi:hypothetical protein
VYCNIINLEPTLYIIYIFDEIGVTIMQPVGIYYKFAQTFARFYRQIPQNNTEI